MSTREEIETLIDGAARKDRAAFAQLYGHTSAKLFGVVLRILKSEAEAEEALQEIYIKVWRNADRYRAGGYSPMTWLITIARNHAIDRLRARRASGAGLDEAHELPDAAPGPEALAMASSDRARILTCFERLPLDRAEAVRRAYIEGETYAELASRFDVPLNTMRTWLRRSLLKLKECLSE
ncbi:sigma-70 family RNA polymerase sigma factor [Pseudooceanicola atlanticus]|jgi:RNA polymerase sigma-70 factor (ECF subfamily)|uniref:RNA polymerase sigma factor n=1 Tax=Pseudooceanicola atlanticus TaxID=1461694 RepID=A0A0A0EHB4_9RHOB|nr:sigma-70 family RNA polymerase sigma factor [Pseudooceanicola atlanticus]KGM48592.1 RNA polymerase sigma factor [Pseudooceanicola atlanticus]